MKIFITCLLSSLEFAIGIIIGVYLAVFLLLHQEWMGWLLAGAFVVGLLFDGIYELLWRGGKE
jgi:hypothetical protein